jgi:hypothetical protein
LQDGEPHGQVRGEREAEQKTRSREVLRPAAMNGDIDERQNQA